MDVAIGIELGPELAGTLELVPELSKPSCVGLVLAGAAAL